MTPTSTPTSTSTSTSTSTQSKVTSPPSTGLVNGRLVLGPFGAASILLGQSESSAAQNSLFVTEPKVTNTCQSWDTSQAPQVGSVLISPTLGVAAIYPRYGAAMQTPEGLTVGWTAAQVHAAYPAFSVSDAHEQDGGPEISVPQNPKAAYKVRFDAGNKVVSYFLMLKNQNCFD